MDDVYNTVNVILMVNFGKLFVIIIVIIITLLRMTAAHEIQK